jgi:hypothetical protein
VADPAVERLAFHRHRRPTRPAPAAQLQLFERALDWLRTYQPKLAGIVERERGQLQDFIALRHFSYGCKRVFSANAGR